MSETAIPTKRAGMTDKHKQLQDAAIRRLYAFGCSAFAKEVPTANGVADALGVMKRTGNVYYIECKQSRSDLICKKQKDVYAEAVGVTVQLCYFHQYTSATNPAEQEERDACDRCKTLETLKGVTHIDFYYIMVADGITVEDTLYPSFGVLDERGNILRKAKRMKRLDHDNLQTLEAIAHVLVYKAYGRLYLGEQIAGE